MAAVLLLFLVLIVMSYFKTKKPLKAFVKTLLSGNASLLLINLTGLLTGVFLPISWLSLGIATIIGIPGVAMMLIVKVFWNI